MSRNICANLDQNTTLKPKKLSRKGKTKIEFDQEKERLREADKKESEEKIETLQEKLLRQAHWFLANE